MPRLARVIIFALFFACWFAWPSRAQTTISSAQRDTVIAPDTGEFHMTKSPLEAVLLSAILPGAGQVYLGQTWKLPILYGLIGAFGYGVYIQNLRYHAFLDTVARDYAAQTSYDTNLAINYNTPTYEFYQNDRDKWWIYLGITYIAQILDAYISANLYDFDVSNPAPSGFESYFDPFDGRLTVSYTLHF